MAHSSKIPNAVERRSKIAADIVCALLVATFPIICLGFLRGIISFLIVEGLLLAVRLRGAQSRLWARRALVR